MEMILEKDPGNFTSLGGWAFLRRVYFDGHKCVMPLSDQPFAAQRVLGCVCLDRASLAGHRLSPDIAICAPSRVKDN